MLLLCLSSKILSDADNLLKISATNTGAQIALLNRSICISDREHKRQKTQVFPQNDLEQNRFNWRRISSTKGCAHSLGHILTAVTCNQGGLIT